MLAVRTYCGLLSQPIQMARSHGFLQYIVWPKTLIFLGITFILPKRLYYLLPDKNI